MSLSHDRSPMCFSAPASFGASALLAAVGVMALRNVTHRRQLLLAAVPLLFSLQQFAEGMIWINAPLDGNSTTVKAWGYLFLLVAQVVWPTWIPCCVLALEHRHPQRIALWVLCVVGASLSAYLAACLIVIGATPDITGHHINYQCDFPQQLGLVTSLAYGVVTIIPLLKSSVRHMPLLGGAIALSYLITVAFYEFYTISVWCYFSAVISVIVVMILRSANSERIGQSAEAPPVFLGVGQGWRRLMSKLRYATL